jgi:hypothetical protein
MISGIYKTAPPMYSPKRSETTFTYKHSNGWKFESEKLISKPRKEVPPRKKRKRNMASNKPKTVKVRKEIRVVARAIYTTWIACTEKYRGDSVPIFIPNALKSDTQPLNQGSLEARMCGWIEQNNEDCQAKWMQILTLLMEGNDFMHKGTGGLPKPTLSWLFSFNSKRDYGINRVLNQEFDWKRGYRSEDGE